MINTSCQLLQSISKFAVFCLRVIMLKYIRWFLEVHNFHLCKTLQYKSIDFNSTNLKTTVSLALRFYFFISDISTIGVSYKLIVKLTLNFFYTFKWKRESITHRNTGECRVKKICTNFNGGALDW